MEIQEKPKKSRRKQNIIPAIILIAGTIAAFLIFGPKNGGEPNLVAQGEAAPAALVKTAVISRDSFKIAKLKKTVTLEALSSQADAVAEFSGRIQSVNFETGDTVSEGQILAIFDQSDLKNSPKVALESARRSFEIAEENLSDTEDLSERNENLAERAVKLAKLQKEETDKTGTDEEKDIAKESVKIAEDQEDQTEEAGEIQKNAARLQVEQVKTALDQAIIAHENTFIKAPVSGTIVSRNVNPEDFLNAGAVAASIVGTGKLEAVVFFSRDEIERIKKGDAVEIDVDGEKYAGSIASFSEIANDGNSRFEVKIISNEDISGKANQTAEAVFDLRLGQEAEGGFFIPLDAVNIGQNKKEIFVAENGKARAKTVELGKIIGTEIEVLSGLSEGDVLITENSRNLTEGQAVRME